MSKQTTNQSFLLTSICSLLLVGLLACGQQDDSAANETYDGNVESEAEEQIELTAWNKFCPVQGEEVDPEVETVAYGDREIGFCCPGCDKKFQEDPEKYVKNLSEDGVEFIGG